MRNRNKKQDQKDQTRPKSLCCLGGDDFSLHGLFKISGLLLSFNSDSERCWCAIFISDERDSSFRQRKLEAPIYPEVLPGRRSEREVEMNILY